MRTFDKNRIRIAAFDLDGTVLLNGEMRPAVQQALSALSRSGIITVVSTGRSYTMVPPEISCYFQAGSFANGGFCKTSDGTVISTNPMDKSKVEALFVKSRELGGDAFYFTPDARIVSQNCYDIAMNWALANDMPDYYQLIKTIHTRWKLDLVPDTLEALRAEKRPVIKVETNFMLKEQKLKAWEYSSRELGFETVIMEKMSLEINEGGVTKATGIKSIADYYGCSMDEVAAFGDSNNDLTMLEACGFAVAMASGDSEAIRRADYVAHSVYEDGIATALKDLFHI